jgi:hypothetical protein
MRNHKQPQLETITQFRDQAGALWCAQVYYPNGKRDPYWVASLSMVGTTISIPCASMSQLWHEIGIRQQDALPGF